MRIFIKIKGQKEFTEIKKMIFKMDKRLQDRSNYYLGKIECFDIKYIEYLSIHKCKQYCIHALVSGCEHYLHIDKVICIDDTQIKIKDIRGIMTI
jgi:hypothetical protein